MGTRINSNLMYRRVTACYLNLIVMFAHNVSTTKPPPIDSMTACCHPSQLAIDWLDHSLSPFPLSHCHLKLSHNRLTDSLKNPRAIMDQVKSSSTVTHINDQGSRHLSQEAIEKLIQQSQEAKQHAYCPYSKFRVGAALLTMDNTVFRGKVQVDLWIACLELIFGMKNSS